MNHQRSSSPAIRAVFFDIDGTLLDGSVRDVPAASKDAIRALQAQGILVCPATYRSLEQVHTHEFDGIDWDGYVLNGGACVYDKTMQCISDHRLSETVKQTIAARASQAHIPLYCDGESRFITEMNPLARSFLEHYAVYPVDVEDYGSRQVSSLTLVSDNGDNVEAIVGDLDAVEAFDVGFGNFDLYPAGVDKASGIRDFMRHHHLDEQSYACYGDSKTDISMIENAAIGVAMGWGDEEVRQAADAITGLDPQRAVVDSLRDLQLLKD